MIRIRKLDISHIRNVVHGQLAFNPLPHGGSLTGIYGPNGSGKTTVIETIGILKQLMSGKPLPAETATLIETGQTDATIQTVIEIDGQYATYRATVSHDGTQPIVTGESIRVSENVSGAGRTVVEWSRKTDAALKAAFRPAYIWDGLLGEPDVRLSAYGAILLSKTEGTSLLFRAEFLDELPNLMETAAPELPAKTRKAMEGPIGQLFVLLRRLRRFAVRGMAILTTRRTALDNVGYIPMSFENPDKPHAGIILDLLRERLAVTCDTHRALGQSVRMYNTILPRLLPGLTLDMDTTDCALADGSPGKLVTLYSNRDGRRVPFRYESEGIIRLVSMLTFLVHAYNDEDACVAIDEFDAGIFEYLLGEIVREFANIRGQFIFTAHNLRVMEVANVQRSIILSTDDPYKRFVPYGHIRRTNNGRKQYLERLAEGGIAGKLCEMPADQMVGVAFTLAGRPELADDSTFDEAASQLERYPVDGLEDLLA